jgi:DNA invertase Pin-like site-specific DNA recombinase
MDRHPDQHRTGLRSEKRRRPTKDATGAPQTSPRELCSSVISHLDEFDPKDLMVILYMRESTRAQRVYHNLENRRKLLRRTLKRLGIDVICSYCEVVTGKQLHDRPVLRHALGHARLVKSSNPQTIVAVVTDARNRFIRGEQYKGDPGTDPPSSRQLRWLEELADGVPLLTVLDPDASFSEVRRYETNVPTALGERSGKKVGRPKMLPIAVRRPGWKKEIRLKKISEVRRLHDAGKSKRKIGRRLDVAESTVRGWLERSQT